MTQKRKVFSRPESSVLLTCNPIHSPPIHASRWRAQKWDLFCPICRGKKISSNITMKHSEGEEDRSWEAVPFKQKWKCFPAFPIPTSHVCWNWRSALPPLLSLLASLWTHTKDMSPEPWHQAMNSFYWTLNVVGSSRKMTTDSQFVKVKGEEKQRHSTPHTLASKLCREQCFPWEQHSYLYS